MSEYKHIGDYKEFSLHHKKCGNKDHYKALKDNEQVLSIATDLGIEYIMNLLDEIKLNNK